MLSYIIKGFFRSLLRRKLFSFINITGLAFGVGFVILIGQYLYHEYSYNSSITNVNNIYRLVNIETKDYLANLDLKEKIKETIPGVTNISIFNHYGIEVNKGNEVYKFDNLLVTDKDFLKMTGVNIVNGSLSSVFDNPLGILISESAAKRMYGKVNVAGNHLTLNHSDEYFIAGVIKDFPSNSSFQADIVVHYENSIQKKIFYNGSDINGDTKFYFNYLVELDNKTHIKHAEKLISGLVGEDEIFHKPYKAALDPLNKNYFNDTYDDRALPHANNSLIEILKWIGISILLLAIFNFINLTTAAYKYRLTEIGVKKCLGLNRTGLIKQLLGETLLICLISSGFGIIIAEVCLPYFNNFTEKNLHLQILSNPGLLALFSMFIILLGIITGLVPAIVLSKISPLQLCKTTLASQPSGINYRSILTTFQFGVTTSLICCLIIMSEQIAFVKHKDPGFNTERLIYIPIHYKAAGNITSLCNKLQAFSTIKSVSKTFGVPGHINLLSSDNSKTICIDTTAVATFGFNIIKGRNLQPGDINRGCLVNETAWKKLAENSFTDTIGQQYAIVGVVSDFQSASFYEKNAPLKMEYNDWFGASHLTVRFNGSTKETVAFIEKTWKELCPDFQFEYGFYDEYFAAQYTKEENLATLISMFSVLAIVISCLGIFGLAFYQSEQRVKEIGIRKVLGASAAEIVQLLTGNFSKWVLLANVFAWPAAYYFMTKWLETFAYRIELSWWMFALSGLIALVIALITISTQTVKAAIANPIKSLKYE